MNKISEAIEKLKKRKLFRLLPVILLATLIIAVIFFFGVLRDQKPEVRASSLHMGDISRVIYITAEIQPGAIVEETVPHQQKVTAVHVKPGDQVHTGDLLLTLDTEELQDQYLQAKKARKEIEASITKAEAVAKTRAKEAEINMKEFEENVNLFFESLSETAFNLVMLRNISPAALSADPEMTASFTDLLVEFDPEAEDAKKQMEILLDFLLQEAEVTDNPKYQDILNDLENDLVNLSSSLSQVLTILTSGTITNGLTEGIFLSPNLIGQLGSVSGTISDPLAQAKLQEDLARERYEESVPQLKASNPGIIGEVNAEVDSYIGTSSIRGANSLDSLINEALGEALEGAPGEAASGRSKAVIIYDNTKPKAVFLANPFDANRLDPGMPVTYEHYGETYNGVITRKAPFAINSTFRTGRVNEVFGGIPGIDGLPNEPKLEIEMSIEGDRLEDLILGFSLEAEIVTESAENVLMLPAEAMRREIDTYYVFVIGKEGKLIKEEFEPGIQSDVFVEVVSGLTIDDRVVLNPTGDLERGIDVKEFRDD